MSDKYIIRNCPCRMELHEDDCFGHTGYYNCCACTNCVLKQIYDLCNKYKEHDIIALQITNLLDIKEIE